MKNAFQSYRRLTIPLLSIPLSPSLPAVQCPPTQIAKLAHFSASDALYVTVEKGGAGGKAGRGSSNYRKEEEVWKRWERMKREEEEEEEKEGEKDEEEEEEE